MQGCSAFFTYILAASLSSSDSVKTCHHKLLNIITSSRQEDPAMNAGRLYVASYRCLNVKEREMVGALILSEPVNGGAKVYLLSAAFV